MPKDPMCVRSLLFVPGDNERMLEKSQKTEADALIFDLEDAVAADAKDAARTSTHKALANRTSDQLVFVRINAYDSGLALDDLCAIMPAAPDGIMLPKCRHGADIERLDHYLQALEASFGLEQGSTLILPIVTELPEAFYSLGDYRNASPRLWGMLWGAEDLSAELGAAGPRRDGAPTGTTLMARNLALIAARSAGVVPVDAVYVSIDDLEGLEREASLACHDGFLAKAIIHPSHIEPVNRIFRPTDAEIERARNIVAAMEKPGVSGAIRLNGELIDRPHYKAAQALLARISD